MKVVLDTNVIVAAFAARGLCADVFELCLKECELVLSRPILEETKRVLAKNIKLPPAKVRNIIQFLQEVSTVVTPAALPADCCRDPEDIPILGTAVAGKADVLLTGDEDLLVLKNFKGTLVVSPRQFWALVARQKPDQ